MSGVLQWWSRERRKEKQEREENHVFRYKSYQARKTATGGYLPLKKFNKKSLGPGEEEWLDTKFHAGTIGLATDYLTRYMMGTPAEEAFYISRLGASVLFQKGEEWAFDIADSLLKGIKGLDDNSIICACKLAGFDVCFRAGAQHYKPAEEINPDENAIANIRRLVERSLHFLEVYGPVTKDGFTFPGGYSELVSAGDGDFLTADTVWDLKAKRQPIAKDQTLQILMYYIMGKRSSVKEFQTVDKLGFFNPIKNEVYQLSVDEIDPEIIKGRMEE